MNLKNHPLHQYPNLLEAAAEQIHKDWMRRTEINDYNKKLHIPYQNLPEDEKEKDRNHLFIICDLLETTPKGNLTNQEYDLKLANAFGSLAHEDWRNGYDPDKTGKPREKDTPEGKTNINVPWEQLHPKYQKDNLEAGKTAVKIYRELCIKIAEKHIGTLSAQFQEHLQTEKYPPKEKNETKPSNQTEYPTI